MADVAQTNPSGAEAAQAATEDQQVSSTVFQNKSISRLDNCKVIVLFPYFKCINHYLYLSKQGLFFFLYQECCFSSEQPATGQFNLWGGVQCLQQHQGKRALAEGSDGCRWEWRPDPGSGRFHRVQTPVGHVGTAEWVFVLVNNVISYMFNHKEKKIYVLSTWIN